MYSVGSYRSSVVDASWHLTHWDEGRSCESFLSTLPVAKCVIWHSSCVSSALNSSCNLCHISLHCCSYHKLIWLQMAEASHPLVRQELSTLIPSVRVKLQLLFYHPLFSSQSHAVPLEYFLLFMMLECSFQS